MKIYKDFLSSFMWISIWAMILLEQPKALEIIGMVGVLHLLLYFVAIAYKDGRKWGGH